MDVVRGKFNLTVVHDKGLQQQLEGLLKLIWK
jgi:hypothetical protein